MSFEEVTLKQLKKGSERAWPIIQRLFLENKISKKDALKALENFLEIKIPEYKQNSEMEIAPGNYWLNKKQEAEQTLEAIKNNNSDLQRNFFITKNFIYMYIRVDT